MHLPLPQPAFPARRLLLKVTALLLGTLAVAQAAWAAPVVQKVSGPLDHSTEVTITGGDLAQAHWRAAGVTTPPATSSATRERWLAEQVARFDIGYKPMRGINRRIPGRALHRRVSGQQRAYSGYAVMMYKTIKVPSAVLHLRELVSARR
jgi:hypothetical protein